MSQRAKGTQLILKWGAAPLLSLQTKQSLHGVRPIYRCFLCSTRNPAATQLAKSHGLRSLASGTARLRMRLPGGRGTSKCQGACERESALMDVKRPFDAQTQLLCQQLHDALGFIRITIGCREIGDLGVPLLSFNRTRDHFDAVRSQVTHA